MKDKNPNKKTSDTFFGNVSLICLLLIYIIFSFISGRNAPFICLLSLLTWLFMNQTFFHNHNNKYISFILATACVCFIFSPLDITIRPSKSFHFAILPVERNVGAIEAIRKRKLNGETENINYVVYCSVNIPAYAIVVLLPSQRITKNGVLCPCPGYLISIPNCPGYLRSVPKPQNED